MGGMWEGGERVPLPPGGEKKICPSFGYEVGPRVRRLLRSETEVGLRVRRWLIFMADDRSSALHGGPPPRPPAFNCTLFHTGIRSCTALALHVAVMDSAVPSLATPQPACCFRSIRSGLQQVRFLRKLMPGKGFYMDVLCYLLKA